MKKKKLQKPVLITQKTPEELVLAKLQQEDSRFIFSDSVDEEFSIINKAKEFFKQTSSVPKTIKLLCEEEHLSPHNARKIFEKMANFYSVVNRALYRELLIDKLFENINETREIARLEANPSAMAKCDDNLKEAIKDFLGSSDAIDQSLLRLPDVIASFHPEWFPDVPAINTKEFELIITKFSIRKDKKAKMEALDIDYEEIR